MNYTIFFSLLISIGMNSKSELVKTVDRNMVMVTENLYASKFEASNYEYKLFLSETESDNKMSTDYRIHNSGWNEVKYREHYGKHVAFNNFPVVNITYEGADAFCKWLTSLYNSNPKRKYDQVVFRLPSKLEWKLAASGGDEQAIYPWKTPFLQDEQGRYHCNFNKINESELKISIEDKSNISLAESPRKASISFLASIDSFNPSENRIYNMSGNAAEMVLERGETQGGSWGSSGYFVRIDAEDEFKGFESSKYVGFRYFMEVISE